MAWNWQLPAWPNFTYDPESLRAAEAKFLHGSGLFFGAFIHLGEGELERIRIDLLSEEALETSRIEGELFNRESLQSSVKRHLGLPVEKRRVSPAEDGVSDLMVDCHRNFSGDLSQERLAAWHQMVMRGRTDLSELGSYRTSGDPMQIVSGPIHHPKVHYEAPPAARVAREMALFIAWFNQSRNRLPALTRSAIAHLYFESIHPFEDGNGRIGRAIAELSLSQSLDKPVLLALSQTLGSQRNRYYEALAAASRTLNITAWIRYFAERVLEAQERTGLQIEFVIKKTKYFDRHGEHLNPRQEKVLRRMFEAGQEGFVGGLSSGNYQRIAKASPATATRDLNELVDMGAVQKTGEKRHTRYYLNIVPPKSV